VPEVIFNTSGVGFRGQKKPEVVVPFAISSGIDALFFGMFSLQIAAAQ
jgi:hypothetical protein